MEFTTGEPTFAPIPATVTPMYDPHATIVVNKGSYYVKEYAPMTAAELESKLIAHTNLSQRVNAYEKCNENVREYLIENYEEIGSEHADEIARLLHIDLVQTVEVQFDVTITTTISLPVGKKFDDLSEYDFDITIESNESDIEVDDFDATIDRMRETS